MKEFIRIQYQLYLSGLKSISIDKIHALADKYLTEDEKSELFSKGDAE